MRIDCTARCRQKCCKIAQIRIAIQQILVAENIGVNPAGDARDVSPPIFWLVGTSMGMSPPIFGVAMYLNVVEYELLIASVKRKQR